MIYNFDDIFGLWVALSNFENPPLLRKCFFSENPKKGFKVKKIIIIKL